MAANDPGRARRRADRSRDRTGLLLTMPLFAFLLVCFVVPVGTLLVGAVANGEVGAALSSSTDWASYLAIVGRTVQIAAIVTGLCLLLGYPLAYRLATLPERWANALLILVLLPFWVSLLVRTMGWMVLLHPDGPVADLARQLGPIELTSSMLHHRTGVLVAMTQVLLPFMVLPLYGVMRSISPDYRCAALSLGARPMLAFRRVYLPLSMQGVVAGCLLVFIMASGSYAVPVLIGGADDQTLSQIIAYHTLEAVDRGIAAALAGVLLACTLLLYRVFARLVGIDRLPLGRA